MHDLFFDSAFLSGTWERDVRVAIDAGGWITSVRTETTPQGARHVPGVAVPGVPNIHSHAFQRAMAGLTERGSPKGENFWTWRERMYGFLEKLDPPAVEAIAARLYTELVRNGFTSVAEFHYLRNDPSGRAYDDPVEMGRRILSAGETAGIGVTILPTVYRASDFGGQPPAPGQRRFTASVEELVGDVAVLGAGAAAGTVRVGLALHSLRAVAPADLAVAVEAARGMDPEIPIHIHVAEQTKEVEACLAWSGARPVEWLMDHAPVDASWCLIHSTHVESSEIRAIAGSGAVIGFCPTTEANLGDGVFPFSEYAAAGGAWAVGTDSNVGLCPARELRMLEYAQRLATRTRNVAAGPRARSTGRTLLEHAWSGGSRACGRRIGRIAPGYRADVVVLDPDHSSLVGRAGDDLLDSWLFAGDESPVCDVFVGGAHVVRDGRHIREDEVAGAYAGIARALAADTPQLALELED
jgi:formimidoylglutamate deiminase